MQVEDKNMGSWLKINVVHYQDFTRTITINDDDADVVDDYTQVDIFLSAFAKIAP